ncbi:carboxymuconolactone decarboxylase family protein [Actinacidiphila yeochonensis]|uniref:carboxymuconolactone decarboxylase family protein n=1 Tax=Actinacidiphila yeochonensis TaxID=89050 RepID=UPI0007C68AF1|nr:carboxymuconolactone decarboxylase family protein [Actinacidiphila yeochonensis]
MVNTRASVDREAGYALMGRLAGPETVEGTLKSLESLAPGFADWIVTALFGGTYQREGLELRDRQIATLAALTALGGVEPQVDDHVRNSLRIGMEPREIVEVMVHLAPYIGVPRALAGLRVAAAVFKETGTDPGAGGGPADGATAPGDADRDTGEAAP